MKLSYAINFPFDFSNQSLVTSNHIKLSIYLAKGLYVCASAQHDLSAGDGDSFNNSMLSRLSHSIQSSFDTRRVAVQAYNDYTPYTGIFFTQLLVKAPITIKYGTFFS